MGQVAHTIFGVCILQALFLTLSAHAREGYSSHFVRGVIPGGAGVGGHSPPNFWPTTLHTPLTERYHHKWC